MLLGDPDRPPGVLAEKDLLKPFLLSRDDYGVHPILRFRFKTGGLQRGLGGQPRRLEDANSHNRHQSQNFIQECAGVGFLTLDQVGFGMTEHVLQPAAFHPLPLSG